MDAKIDNKENIHLIITNNLKDDRREIKVKNIKATLLINENIRGFSENHNAAFNFFKKKSGDIFFVLNPDVVINKFDAEKIQQLIMNDSEQIIYSPKNIYYNCNHEQKKTKYPLTFGSSWNWCGNKNIEWVSGEAMIFSVETYRRLNGFDPKFHLYVEDVDLCLRNRKLGGRIEIIDQIEIFHEGRRLSHRSLKYFKMHIFSSLKFYVKLIKGAYR